MFAQQAGKPANGFIADDGVITINPDPKCGWTGFEYNKDLNVCTITIGFSKTPPVSCSPVTDEDDHRVMTCWYTPK